MTYHQTIVVGNLGSDPETRQLPSGTSVTSFSLAVNESWTDRQTNERREKTTWYRVSAFGRLGEISGRYLAKGRQVMVVGTVEANAYMGQDGQPRASLDLRAREVKFLQGGGDTGGYGNNNHYDSNNYGNGNSYGDSDYDTQPSPPDSIDDIPF